MPKKGDCLNVPYGVGYFYSGLQGRAINSIQFLSFSIIDVKTRRAYPLFTKQLKKKKKKIEEKKPKGKVGRPKGSKNKNSSSARLKGLFKVVNWYLKIIRKTLNLPELRYFVYDGAFGNNVAFQFCKFFGMILFALAISFRVFSPFNNSSTNLVFSSVLYVVFFLLIICPLFYCLILSKFGIY